MSHLSSPRFLRTVMLLDADSVLLCGVPQVLATAWLARWTGLDHTLLLASGVFLLVYAAFASWIGTRQPIPPPLVLTVILGNVLWAVGCVGLIAAAPPELPAWGHGYLLLNIAAVMLFAALQWVGVRHAQGLVRTAA
jgi:hypothetical protein